MRKILLLIGGIIAAIIVGVITSGIIWYNIQLSPVGSDVNQFKKITIASGDTPSQIGESLEKQSIIHSGTAFNLYARLTGKSNSLQAGIYRLYPSETTPQILKRLVDGSVEEFSITFLPGATLVDNTDKLESKEEDITSVLRRAGYSDEEISSALNDTYDSPLFEGKPSGTDLEGYIYGETYNFDTGATVQDILKRTFDEFYAKIVENNLITGFANHNLTLYEGITLASIIQREVSGADDQKKAAQVFYLRLNSDELLGSDVTYQYIADKTGVPRDLNLDSPYNTRLYSGLPPGPIATPGLSALLAVSSPAEGDYKFFLSGDDGITYFAYTNAEHEANKANYCKIKCLPL